MQAAVSSSLGIVAYLALFASVGLLFIFVNLLVGRFVRPSEPNEEKLDIYECGEPTIGSSFVQFDLRFYVIALLFIIFDVEVAFFFPWAAVFGKSTHMMDKQFVVAEATTDGVALTTDGKALYRELGVRKPTVPQSVPASLQEGFQKQFPAAADFHVNSEKKANYVSQQGARQLAWITVADIGVFFAVLMIGFAYVWKRGDLDWVRAVSRERGRSEEPPPGSTPTEQEPALSA